MNFFILIRGSSSSPWSPDSFTFNDTSIGRHWMGVDVLDYEEKDKRNPAQQKLSGKYNTHVLRWMTM